MRRVPRDVLCILRSGVIYPKDRTRFTHLDVERTRNSRVNAHEKAEGRIVFDREKFDMNLKNKEECGRACVIYKLKKFSISRRSNINL